MKQDKVSNICVTPEPGEEDRVVQPHECTIIFRFPDRWTSLSTWHEHIPFAMYAVAAFRPRVIVELGTQAGDSYCAFCQAVDELGLDSRCYAIDTWGGDPHTGPYGPEVLEDLKGHHNRLYERFSRLVKVTFDEGLANFADGEVDLLHIDGYHTYEAVHHDFLTWLPKMSDRGVVLLHDTNVREGDFGVWQFWSELRRRFPHCEFTHGHGLGVVLVGNTPPATARWLTALPPSEGVALRNLFSQLGQRIALFVELETRKKDIEALSGEAKEALRERSGLVRQMAAQEHRVEHLQAVKGALEAEASRQRVELAERERQVEELEVTKERVGELEREMAIQLQAGQALEAEVSRQQVELAERERQVEELEVTKERVGELEHRIAQLHATKKILEEQARQVERDIQRMQSSKSWRLTLPLRWFYFRVARASITLRSLLWRWRQRLVGIRELWFLKVCDQLSLSSLEPVTVDVGSQHLEGAIRWIPEIDIGNEKRFAFFTHPPACVTYQFKVPPMTVFRAFPALHPEVWGRNPNGVEFRVSVSSRGKGRPILRRLWIHPTGIPSHCRWHEFRVSLARFANQEVEFTLSTSIPRERPADYAWAIWGDPTFWSYVPVGKIWSVFRGYLRTYGLIGVLAKISNVAQKLAEPGNHAELQRYRLSRLADFRDNGRILNPAQILPVSPPQEVEGPTDWRYAAWLTFNGFNKQMATALQAALRMREGRLPNISIIMPAYNASVELLDRAVKSVLSQVYESWELCIAEDASPDPHTIEAIRRWTRLDSRIKVVPRDENGGISRATNSAVDIASGDFLVFLDQDDELTPDALAEVAIYCADHPDVKLVYSDDDKIDIEGRPFAPQFKPGWSPILLLSYMYMGHLLVVRRSLFDELCGFRIGFEGSQDHDFALRASERVEHVGHIPKVLYHWRAVPGSTAVSGDAKPASFTAGRRAVAEAFERRGLVATVKQPDWAVDAKVGIFAPFFPHTGPKVAIIIPARNRLDLLRSCIESLKMTRYENYEIVIIDNESDDAKVLDYLHSLPYKVLRIANPSGEFFNFAHVNNQAARQVDADYVLFLNNDMIVRTPDWLSQMMGYARMEKVGVVGARLLFPDGTIQHAGVVHGCFDGMFGHAFRNLPSRDKGYLSYTMVAREYSAVTAACLLTPRALFLEQGGFDETNFAIACNDADYCYRLVDQGYRCVYCPSAELIHLEGKSRGFSDSPEEIATFRHRYGSRVDPWYNANLSLDDEHFRVRPYHMPPPVDRPVRATLVSHNLNLEGAPNHQLELTVGLARHGIIDPVVLSPVDGPLRARYEEAGIPVRIIPSPLIGTHAVRSFDDRLDDLTAVYHELGTEVVFGNTLLSFWAIAAGDRAGLPTIWYVHESEPWQTYFDFLPPELRRCAYGCFAYPYRVIFVAHANREVWQPLEARFNFTVIRWGLDLARLEQRLSGLDRAATRRNLGIASDEIAIVLVGTVCERKGQLDLVRALFEMPPSVTRRVRAFIIGDRPSAYSATVHHELDALPSALRQRLAVVPETDEVPAYYKAADVAVCTSRIEAYPAVILEAMACGLPIVTTPVFGIREQVREGINALFCEPGNPATLAAALTRFVEDDNLRHQLAKNSRRVLASLPSYSEMLERCGEIFREARFSKGAPLDISSKLVEFSRHAGGCHSWNLSSTARASAVGEIAIQRCLQSSRLPERGVSAILKSSGELDHVTAAAATKRASGQEHVGAAGREPMAQAEGLTKAPDSSTTEFYIPGQGLNFQSYMNCPDVCGLHHLARYEWASAVLADCAAAHILDIACGAGYGSYLLGSRLPHAVITGCDYDPRAKIFAEENYKCPNATFRIGNIETWIAEPGHPIGTFDAIVSFDTIEHLLHREIALLNLANNLSDDGILLLSTPCHPENILNPEWEHHKIEYSCSTLMRLMRRFFSAVIQPSDPDFPRRDFWTQIINKDAIRYSNAANPLVCRRPIRG